MRILLASDGTDQTRGAARFAADLARDGGGTVDVLRVLDPLTLYEPTLTPMLAYPEPDFSEEREAAARDAMVRQVNGVDPSVDWKAKVEIGPVAPTIVRAAAREGAEVILLGSGSHGRLDRWFGGETAVRVMQISHIPIVAVPDGDGRRPGILVAAVDFSDFSQRAVLTALKLGSPVAALHLVHVVQKRPFEMGDRGDEWFDQVRAEARRQLEDWAAKLRSSEAAGTRIELHPREGDPTEEILRVSEDVDADMIAAGSHGLGFLGRLVLGSVSSRLIRGAKCAVLIAPPAERAIELDTFHYRGYGSVGG